MKGTTLRVALVAGLVSSSGMTLAFTLPGIHTPAKLSGRVALVTQGSIVSTLTQTGTAADITSYSLTFGAAGTVQSVLVKAGQKVTKNQLLATLSDPSLQLSLLSDQNAVRTAQLNLAKELAPPNANTVVQAQASLDQAQSKLAAMKAGGTAASIAQARASLDSAKAKLVALQAGTASAIITAQASLDSAQQKLAAMEAGGTTASIAQAETTLATAQAKLAAMQAVLFL